MTYYEIAKRLGVSDTAVGNWYNGKSMPSSKNLVALAKLLGKDTETVLKEFLKIKSDSK